MTEIRDASRNLVEATWVDEWPRAGAIVDFGLRTQAHDEAPDYGVRDGRPTPEQLDAALSARGAEGAGAGSNPHREIRLRTDRDAIRKEDRPGDAGPAAPESNARSIRTPLGLRSRQRRASPTTTEG